MNYILVILALISVCFAASLHRVKLNRVEGSYIVVFKHEISQETLSADLKEIQDIHNVTFQYTYENALKGFAAPLDSDQLAAILNHPRVDMVEEDQIMHALQGAGCTYGNQNTYPYGVQRCSSQVPRYDGYYSYRTSSGAGSSVYVYVIDTGIYNQHSEFGGRASLGFKATPSWSDTDANGHGTHVASTIGGTRYGMAPQCNLIGVKVLGDNGSGTNAGVIAGVNYAASNCQGSKCCANMSLGGSYSAALNTACNNAVASGIVLVVAAGNENQDACNVSPASATSVITVASTDQNDVRSSFSNHGPCCSMFAPGSNILGAWIGSTTASRTISGTSMASPHVCGAAALILGEGAASPGQVYNTLLNTGADGYVTLNCGGACGQTPNIIAQNGCNRG